MIVAVRAVVDPIIFVLLIQRCRLAESWQYYGYLWFDFLPLETCKGMLFFYTTSICGNVREPGGLSRWQPQPFGPRSSPLLSLNIC